MNRLKKVIGNYSRFELLFIFLSYLIISIFLIQNVLSGGIPFWFDPARDLLSALNNLNSPTLIGPHTGIPGLFYGPYWIWMLSSALLVSYDPRIVTILVLTIPYLIFLPLLLFGLKSTSGKVMWFILFILYISAYPNYATFIWNPHPAFLLTFFLVYLVIHLPSEIKNKKSALRFIFIGIILGLILNFHLSFGLGVGLGTFMYFLFFGFVKRDSFAAFIKSAFKAYVLVGIGFLLTFGPFFFFEIRHGFNQLQVLNTLIINASLYDTPLVGQQGLSHKEITQSFVSQIFTVLHIEKAVGIIKLIVFLILVYLLDKLIYLRNKLSQEEYSLLFFCLVCIFSVLYMFQSSKYPVWEYHFGGIEIFFLLLIGLIARKNFIVKIGVLVISCIAVIGMGMHNFRDWGNPLSVSSLYTKEYIVNTVIEDASDVFTVYAYSPSIYTYDYDYLFKWKTMRVQKSISEDSSTVYLIIPQTNQAVFEDFIHYKTPDEFYTTAKTWDIPDESTIIKRIKN